MRATRRLAAPLAALILAAAPTAAFAQNAGDEQYADPFGNSSQSGGGGSSGSGSSGSSGSTGTTGTTGSGSGVAAAQQQGTAAAGTTTSGSTASSGQLPRTGLDVGIVAAVGAALLLGGLALRRRSADARG